MLFNVVICNLTEQHPYVMFLDICWLQRGNKMRDVAKQRSYAYDIVYSICCFTFSYSLTGKTAVGFLRTGTLSASHCTVQLTVYKSNY